MAASGAVEFAALKTLVTGNLGLALALACTAYGAYLVLVQQKFKTGFVLLITAASIPLLMDFMDAMRVNFCPAVEMLGGDCGSTSIYSDGGSASKSNAAVNGSLDGDAAGDLLVGE